MNLTMKHQPLTLEEAQTICIKSQHLVGLPLNPQIHAHGRIERVVVAPFTERAQQKRFAESLMNTGDALIETLTVAAGYTVLVVGRPLRWVHQSVLFLDVRSYQRMADAYIRHRALRRASVAA